MALEAYHAQMAAIRARFAGRVVPLIADLQTAYDALASGSGDAAALHRGFHDISGTAPTLGFAALGAEARRLELIVAAAVKQSRALTAEELADLGGGLRLLARHAEAARAEADTPAAQGS